MCGRGLAAGGGLLSGTALGAKGIRAEVRIFGCEPERADDAYRSFATGTLQTMEQSDTIADGLRASLAPRTFAILRRTVERILLVSEPEIISAMRTVWERMKILIEPSSAIALAPLLRPGGVGALGLSSASGPNALHSGTAKSGCPMRPKFGVILSGSVHGFGDGGFSMLLATSAEFIRTYHWLLGTGLHHRRRKSELSMDAGNWSVSG